MRSRVTSCNLFAYFLSHLQNATYFQLKIVFRIGILEVTRSAGWEVGGLLGSKIALWAIVVFKKYDISLHDLHSGPIWAIP